LARVTKWARKPIDSDEIQSQAARFSEAAKQHIFVGEGLTIDAPLVARAIRYLTQAHGLPFDDDALWLSQMLTAVLEIARPNSGLDAQGKEFLKDMRDGISSILDDN
jgi:hypothetical protein